MSHPWQPYLDTHQDQFVTELFDFLHIPSISSLPENADDVREAGRWVMARLEKAGIDHIEMMETGGHPVVYGEWLEAGDNAPTVMIYGHFDTQPADPIELWDHPPFEPTLLDGRVYARGASDDKGNMLVPILAVEAMLETTGKLPLNVKFFFEGQEEIGSPQLPDFVEQHREKFACDMVVSADGGQYGEEQPSLLVGLKGLAAMQVDIVGPDRDLHSGMYGGAVQNPIHALVHILSTLRGADGKILVEGFYDNVVDLSDDDRERIAAVPFDQGEYTADLAVDDVFGEPGYSTRERAWARPTLEINGIGGGFQGDGVKTVLPSKAQAKITCRLVADQEPQRIVDLLREHIEQHALPGVQITVTPGSSSAKPYLMPADHPGNEAARAVHQELYGKEPYYVRSGGSIPFCSLFKNKLGVYTVNFGFGLEDERQHSPNEFFSIEQLRARANGVLSAAGGAGQAVGCSAASPEFEHIILLC